MAITQTEVKNKIKFATENATKNGQKNYREITLQVYRDLGIYTWYEEFKASGLKGSFIDLLPA